jgi:hypothetical protein
MVARVVKLEISDGTRRALTGSRFIQRQSSARLRPRVVAQKFIPLRIEAGRSIPPGPHHRRRNLG